MTLIGSQGDLLARLLDVAGQRHGVIAQNIANVNTPGYRRLDVAFEESLARALSRGGEMTGGGVEAKVVERPGGAERADGNNVDIDAELGRLNKNSLLYHAYSQLLASRLAAMRSAITGR